MPSRILAFSLALLGTTLPALAEEPSWQGKTVLLTRPGVKLQVREGEKIAPKTGGVARDLTFGVLKEEDGRLRISSRRQVGWISRSDAVPFDEALDYFSKK